MIIDNSIKVEMKQINLDEVSFFYNIPSHFEEQVNTKKISVDYSYLGEPNNGRIQLKLSGQYDGKDIISDFQVESALELPFQYPGYFQLIDKVGQTAGIPHNRGVYLLRIDNLEKYLILYQTNSYRTSFFIDDTFVLVEDKGIKLVELSSLKEKAILFDNQKYIILSVQMSGNNIYVIVNDVKDNQLLLFVFFRDLFSIDNSKKYILRDLVETNSISEKLRFERQSILTCSPDFKFMSLIDSWRFLPSNKWNVLNGMVQEWYLPEKDEESFIRKEKFDYIELYIDTII